MKYVYPGIDKILRNLPSFHQDALKDVELKKKWEQEKKKRLAQSTHCAYCGEEFTNVRFSVLHGNEQIFASKYKLVLPSEAELRAELDREQRILLGTSLYTTKKKGQNTWKAKHDDCKVRKY